MGGAKGLIEAPARLHAAAFGRERILRDYV
jgi:hypothetical protein